MTWEGADEMNDWPHCEHHPDAPGVYYRSVAGSVVIHCGMRNPRGGGEPCPWEAIVVDERDER